MTRRELSTKATKPKYWKMTRKPRTYVTILLYRTWGIVLFRLLRNLTKLNKWPHWGQAISRYIWHNVKLRFTIRHLHICHNAPHPRKQKKKKLKNLCFSIIPRIAAVPREIKNNASAKWGALSEICKWRIENFPVRVNSLFHHLLHSATQHIII